MPLSKNIALAFAFLHALNLVFTLVKVVTLITLFNTILIQQDHLVIVIHLRGWLIIQLAKADLLQLSDFDDYC